MAVSEASDDSVIGRRFGRRLVAFERERRSYRWEKRRQHRFADPFALDESAAFEIREVV